MRYRDAAHVDMGSFYARRPEHGKMYRLLGYAGIVAAWWHLHDADMLSRLLIVLVVLWFMAWFRIVGALWRSSVVAACLLCAVLVSAHRLQLLGHAP
jgi:hypothetical protein